MFKPRTFIAAVMIIVLAAFAAGCGSEPASSGSADTPASAGGSSSGGGGGSVTITFWKAPHIKTETEVWEEIIAKFEEENPGINVEFLETPWDGWDEKYTAAFAGSNPPDVSYMSEYFVKFAQNGKLADLSGYFTEDERAMYSSSIIDYLTIDGKIYTKPFLAGTSVVLYNKDLFAEAGVEIPQTWEEMVEVARTLTKEPDQWGVAGLDNLNTVAFMGQAGANLYADNNKDITKLGFNTPEGIRGLQFMADLVLKEKVAPPYDFYPTGEQQQQAFYEGKIGMYYSQVSFTGTIETNAPDLNYGAFLNPAGPADDPAKQREAYAGIGTLAIAEASQYKDEAWKFIQFVTSPDNAKMYLEKAGFLSPMPEANEEMYAGNEVMEVAKKSVENMIVWTPNEKFGSVLDIVKQIREAALLGIKTPEEAIRDAVAEYENAN